MKKPLIPALILAVSVLFPLHSLEAVDPSKNRSERDVAKRITDVQIENRSDGVEVVLSADGVMTGHESFTLDHPPRIVVDMHGVTHSLANHRISVRKKSVVRIRIGSHPGKVRAVLDLDAARAAAFAYRISRRDHQLHVFIPETVPTALEDAVENPGSGVSHNPDPLLGGVAEELEGQEQSVVNQGASWPQETESDAPHGDVTRDIDPLMASAERLEAQDALREGITQYRLENYEESVEILRKARAQNPESSAAAFYLGMAYKQIIDYPKALQNLEDAVTLEPRIEEALVELIDVLYLLDELERAKKWIEVAEREDVSPAKIAFLKGAVLHKEGNHLEAVQYFEKAKKLDESMAQSADFQIGMSLLKKKKLKKAKERFRAVVVKDPQTDLGSFARYYHDLVERRISLERPVHFTAGLYGLYDTNVVLEPSDSALAGDITNERTNALVTRARLDYTPRLPDSWLFNAYYTYEGRFNKKNSHTHDIAGHSVFMAPGYNLGRFSLSLATNYSYYTLHRKRYLSFLNVGPLVRAVITDGQLIELFAGYTNKEYFQAPLIPEEDRDSDGLDAYLSWTWLLENEGFINFRYEFLDEYTDGRNWDYIGHRLSLLSCTPLARFANTLYDDSQLNLQLGGELFLQDFKHHHVLGPKRDDEVYHLTAALTWDFLKNTSLIAQFDQIWAESNLEIFDYDRSIATIGVEYRY